MLSRVNLVPVKITDMSLNDRFTKIQQKFKSANEHTKKKFFFSFNMNCQPEVASPLISIKEYSNKNCIHEKDRLHCRSKHDRARSKERMGVYVHSSSDSEKLDKKRRKERQNNSKADVLERRSLTSNDYKSIAKTSRSRKRKYWLSKQKELFPRKGYVLSKEDLDQQLDQIMLYTKQKQNEELTK